MTNRTPGKIEYVPSTEFHGPYITTEYGSTICDFYLMSHPSELSTLNGGRSKPVPFLAEMADPNAEFMVKAWNHHDELVAALKNVHALITEGAMTGFNCHDGDWAERLFFSQRQTSEALKKVGAMK